VATTALASPAALADRAICEEGAEPILVSRHPDSRRAEDLVGVVTGVPLVRLVATHDEISR
jgi:hypothetical protein